MDFKPGLSRNALSELIGRANRSRGRATKAAMERILADIPRLEELGKKLNVRLEPERIAGRRKPPHNRS